MTLPRNVLLHSCRRRCFVNRPSFQANIMKWYHCSPWISSTVLPLVTLATTQGYCTIASTTSAAAAIRIYKNSRAFSSTRLLATEEASPYSSSYHAPVMWKECINALLESSSSSSDSHDESNDERPRYFVDGTLGGGGHSEALLQQCRPQDVVFGCDVDPDALATASERLAAYTTGDDPDKPLFVPVESNFCQLASILPSVLHPKTNKPILPNDDNTSSKGQVDGILLDLGVSSFQIDTPERGFAFMKDGPLDMRMNTNGTATSSILTAADLCNELDGGELARILSVYGDEPRSRSIARAIVEHRPLRTTGQLVAAVASVVPEFVKKRRRQGRTATLARVFQALRIVVNREDVVLAEALTEMAPTLLRPGGRLVVLSYHSMEDRMVKNVLRSGTVPTVDGRRRRTYDVDSVETDIYGNRIGPPLPFAPVGKRRKATEAEVESNPRARSATLRVGVRQ